MIFYWSVIGITAYNNIMLGIWSLLIGKDEKKCDMMYNYIKVKNTFLKSDLFCQNIRHPVLNL